MSKKDTPKFTLTIQAEPGFPGTLAQRLRAFLKLALRGFGIRCVKFEPVKEQSERK